MASQVCINEDHRSTLAKLDLEKGHSGIQHQGTLYQISRPNKALTKESLGYGNESFNSSTSTLIAEKESQMPCTTLPEKKHARLWRNLRYTFLQVYHRLSALIIIVNLAIIIACCASKAVHPTMFESRILGVAAATNISAAILVRQELVINLLFALVGKCPQSLPLRLRCVLAKIYHLGGVHAGAAISGSMWFVVMNAILIRTFDDHMLTNLALALLSITISILLLLLVIIVLSLPTLRSRFHNSWEITHRFAGWTAIGLFWAHLTLATQLQLNISGDDTTFAILLGSNPIFWLLFVTTIALILPWLRLRRVPVRAEALSNHAVRLHLGYTNVPLCTAPKFSHSPLREWHSFAAIPEENGSGFSILVSRAGDWTKRIIEQPPKELWTKGVPTRGVLHVAPIFNSLVLVATGSGIGPILSLLYARNIRVRIIWSTRDPIATFKRTIVDQVLLADPEAVIINTSEYGRPDLVQEAYQLYRASRAEAIFVVSNPAVTRKVVYGLESRGIPTFAPIFDS